MHNKKNLKLKKNPSVKLGFFQIIFIMVKNARLDNSERPEIQAAYTKNIVTDMINICKKFLHKDTVIIGCGGIVSKTSADEKLKAGANLLQVYTGLVYQGLRLIKQINN